MATASGQVTNAVFGFTSMLINVIKDHQPDGMIVAFDRPEPTFRHEAEPEYKAQRDAAPDILRQQMGLVREVLDALGIQQIEAAGWEADDLIATAVDEARRARRRRHHRHRRPRQLPARRATRTSRCSTTSAASATTRCYDEAGIAERTGVTPALYPQYAALRGDNSDNLPGVPGVGEKTAAKLINKYGGLDGIFAHVDEQTPEAAGRTSTEHEERARKNLELMILRHDAPIDSVDLRRPRDHPEARRGPAAVRLPRVPHARRPPGRGAGAELGDRSRARRATSSSPRSRRSTTPRPQST